VNRALQGKTNHGSNTSKSERFIYKDHFTVIIQGESIMKLVIRCDVCKGTHRVKLFRKDANHVVIQGFICLRKNEQFNVHRSVKKTLEECLELVEERVICPSRKSISPPEYLPQKWNGIYQSVENIMEYSVIGYHPLPPANYLVDTPNRSKI